MGMYGRSGGRRIGVFIRSHCTHPEKDSKSLNHDSETDDEALTCGTVEVLGIQRK
jgi:hypothetical protein